MIFYDIKLFGLDSRAFRLSQSHCRCLCAPALTATVASVSRPKQKQQTDVKIAILASTLEARESDTNDFMS